jgi:hypothetical protein
MFTSIDEMKFGNMIRILACGMIFSVLPLTQAMAAQSQLTVNQVGDHGGGGCIGETRVYAAAPSAWVLKNESLNPFRTFRPGVSWREASGRVVAYDSFVATTVGCGADRIVAGVNGKTYSLSSVRVEQLGVPVTYLDESNADSPRVTVVLLMKLHEVEFKETECIQRFNRVRVTVEIAGAKKTFVGTAINGCP